MEGYNCETNITNEEATQTIGNLPPEIRVVADKYLDFGNPPKRALKMAEAQVVISSLDATRKAVAQQYLDWGHSPVGALEKALGKSFSDDEPIIPTDKTSSTEPREFGFVD